MFPVLSFEENLEKLKTRYSLSRFHVACLELRCEL